MGLLSGQLAKAVYAGFKGKLLKGQLRRTVSATSGGLDSLGDPISVDDSLFSFEGFTENYDASYAARAGIPETDLKVNIFAASLATTPTKDDKAEIPLGSGIWYQVRSFATDPATALWVCRAYKCKAPS